ncbi:unnamed protein product [Soboliphyme baturini]|uniref:Aldo_ket_red domain-containing protein n=1 Tax=Soboliphyme baturini TaxID=241478 RepID=A0A183J067_9BILA|nr:unnamed protein product [Soboliphyme baturini]
MFMLKKAQSYQPIITLLLARCAVRSGVPYEDPVAEATGESNGKQCLRWTRERNLQATLHDGLNRSQMTTDVETEWQLFKSGMLESAGER